MTRAIVTIPVQELNQETGELIQVHSRGFEVEKRDDGEIWGYLTDHEGWRLVFSLPIISPRYGDGYLDKFQERGPHNWVVCFGNGCHYLEVSSSSMLDALHNLGFLVEYPAEDPDSGTVEDRQDVPDEQPEEERPVG